MPTSVLVELGRIERSRAVMKTTRNLIALRFWDEHLLEGVPILEAGKGRLPSLPAHSERV